MTRFIVLLFSVSVMVLGARVVSGQNYPNKPIRIVTGAAGNANDFLARLVVQAISGPMGQPVIIENRPAGPISIDIVAKAPPDGYTLLVTSGTLWIGALLQKVPYDPVSDFSPITTMASVPQILVVHPSLPVKSVKDLIALAKAKPGELNYASGSTGGSSHIGLELFKAMAGINMVRINYSAGTIPPTISGEVQLTIDGFSALAPHIKSGKLRALAVTSAQSSRLLPGLPTLASSVPGYEAVGVFAIFAPAKTPTMLINRLNEEIVRVLNKEEVNEKLFNAGMDAVGGSPEQLAATIKAEMDSLGKLFKGTGISAIK